MCVCAVALVTLAQCIYCSYMKNNIGRAKQMNVSACERSFIWCWCYSNDAVNRIRFPLILPTILMLWNIATLASDLFTLRVFTAEYFFLKMARSRWRCSFDIAKLRFNQMRSTSKSPIFSFYFNSFFLSNLEKKGLMKLNVNTVNHLRKSVRICWLSLQIKSW